MSVLQLEEDNEAIVKAIEQGEIERLTDCILNFYRKYPDDGTVSSYKDALSGPEKNEFDDLYPVYEKNFDNGLIILNNYVKANIDNYLNCQDKKKFYQW